jgi:flavin-dependent dehydrogenase
VSDGLLLVGDAAAAINPMTGEGLAMALRGAELAADAADRAMREARVARRHLAAYEHTCSAAFRDTWYASRFLQWIVRRPGLARALFRRVAVDPVLAARLVAVVSGGGRGRDLLAPEFLTRLALARGRHG